MTIHIQENIALAPKTTMRVGGNARYFVEVANIEELIEALNFTKEKKIALFVLGAGSNTIVSAIGFDGMVIQIAIGGTTFIEGNVSVGAGVLWDNFVHECVEKGLWGIENLSLIPGSVGGAAVQNIGAYGVEARETIFSVEVFDRETMQVKTFLNEKCNFGYRDSIFKQNKNLIVLKVNFHLQSDGVARTEYADVKTFFGGNNLESKTLNEMRNAIISIRTAKLPGKEIGTAGSFFKNPIVSAEEYERLLESYPELTGHVQADSRIKLSAAWLLDHVGNWKGYRKGDAGVHEKQALILVNYGSATAEEIVGLAKEMKESVKEKTNVTLEEEVVVI